MDSQATSADVVIIGGGMAGLAAATYLARDGMAVTLFEKSSNLGGRAASSNHDGYWFNRGIHALYGGGATEHVLKELGIPYHGGIPKTVHVLAEGKLHLFPDNPRSLVGSHLLDMRDKWELIRFFPALSRMKPKEWASVSVQEWLAQTFQRPKLRQLMAALARTNVYSAALDLVSAEVNIKKLQMAVKSTNLYLDGGWQTLIDGLAQAAEEAGARIVRGSRVEAVEHREDHVQGVRMRDGSLIHASAVILATGPQDACKLVDAGNYAPLRQTVDRIVPGHVACLDVALRRLPDPRYTIVQDLEKPRFFSVQSRYSDVAPRGGALVYAFKQLDPVHPSDPRQDERDLEDLLDTAQPGWRDVVVKRFYLPRIDGVSMLPTARDGGYASRPGPQVPGLTNLYLAGDWIGEGFLSDPSMGSARQVARLLLQDTSCSREKTVAAGLVR
ncbi:MAG: NAD(P)/FAD-dependent oxidoreductase [Ktedonobacteraceae bacterium]|nr:NAD(P)/FAD-dependent oxidoreductase [Ktedonobacteraceae bacterium]